MFKNFAPSLRSVIVCAGLGAAFIALPVCAQPAPKPTAAPHTVEIKNFSFAPKEMTVAQGTAVVWINHDEEPHTIVSSDDPKAFKSPPLDGNDSFSFVFQKPGVYKYYCSVHPHMTGTIIVN